MTAGNILVEICVDDVAGAVAAEQEGAHRIELCSALSEGGITPSIGLVRSVLERVDTIGVQVMVRPRGGDFTVSAEERRVMLADIAAILALPRPPGVTLGFVFGALTADGQVDAAIVAQLTAACDGAPVTFHKAFDRVSDPMAALAGLIDLKVDRVLTSGCAPTAEAGAATLARLQARAGRDIAILAAGGIRAGNAAAVVARTGVREIHLRAMRERPGRPPVTAREEIAAVMRAVGAA